MKEFGLWFIIFGIVTILLSAIGIELKLLSWIDNWGKGTGYLIRYGSIFVGIYLWLKGHGIEQAKEEARRKKLNKYKY